MGAVDVPEKDKAGHPIIAPNAGCVQPVVLPNGKLLLPVRYQRSKSKRNYVSIVAECDFDGKTLKYLQHGSELEHPRGRGLYEPSLARFEDEFFITLRADHDGFVAKSKDGLNFQPYKQ